MSKSIPWNPNLGEGVAVDDKSVWEKMCFVSLWTIHKAHKHLKGTEVFYRKEPHSTVGNNRVFQTFSVIFLTPLESADLRVTKVFSIKQKGLRHETNHHGDNILEFSIGGSLSFFPFFSSSLSSDPPPPFFWG